jgi:hypothetical protein
MQHCSPHLDACTLIIPNNWSVKTQTVDTSMERDDTRFRMPRRMLLAPAIEMFLTCMPGSSVPFLTAMTLLTSLNLAGMHHNTYV